MGYTAALLTVIAKPRPSGHLLQTNVHAGAALQPGVPSAALAEQRRYHSSPDSASGQQE